MGTKRIDRRVSNKERYATNKPKSEWKKQGRKKELLKKLNDTFECSFTISNTQDYTHTKHSLDTYGNFDGILNHITAWFNYHFHNHYKQILQNNYLPYSNNINPSNLHKSQNQKVLKDNSTMKSRLIDEHLLSPFSLTNQAKQSANVNESQLIAKLSKLSPEQLDKLIKLVS